MRPRPRGLWAQGLTGADGWGNGPDERTRSCGEVAGVCPRQALEKIDRKIEELCRVQFGVLEKITELKSVENEVKALSECVGGQAGLKRENSDLTGVSTQKPGQLPGKSPTPDSCKGEGSPGVKHERKPLQKSNKEKVKISHLVWHSGQNPATVPKLLDLA